MHTSVHTQDTNFRLFTCWGKADPLNNRPRRIPPKLFYPEGTSTQILKD